MRTLKNEHPSVSSKIEYHLGQVDIDLPSQRPSSLNVSSQCEIIRLVLNAQQQASASLINNWFNQAHSICLNRGLFWLIIN
jgi:hypothetical protein